MKPFSLLGVIAIAPLAAVVLAAHPPGGALFESNVRTSNGPPGGPNLSVSLNGNAPAFAPMGGGGGGSAWEGRGGASVGRGGGVVGRGGRGGARGGRGGGGGGGGGDRSDSKSHPYVPSGQQPGVVGCSSTSHPPFHGHNNSRSFLSLRHELKEETDLFSIVLLS